MKHFTTLMQMIVTLLVTGCNNRTEIKVVDAKISEVHDSTYNPPPPPIPQSSGLKVTAHLIFDDGSVSSFDVLNDKSIALWNTIIGAGDALKPSNSIKVNLTGALDGLKVRIKNGTKLVINTTIVSNIDTEFIIKNTGCDKVTVNVSKNTKILYNDTIPFHCGE
jgi:uncharacterized lipoprotein NlpE involved in copper resistance